MKVAIDSIVVGERRRQDHGDIVGLAQSIARYGLLHPVVIDDADNLVAGGRRLLACRQLDWREVEVRRLGELSEAERREIELEENLQRKDLTAFEESRTLVALAETAAEVLRESADFPSEFDGKARKGRPPKADSREAIADRLGVSPSTLTEAAQHVAAVEAHPHLADEPQSVALDFAKAVKEQPELADLPAPPRQIIDLARQRKEEAAATADPTFDQQFGKAFATIAAADPTVRAANAAAAFSRWAMANAALLQWEPEEMAAHLPANDLFVTVSLPQLEDWLTRFHQARKGPRLLKGATQ